MENIKWQDIFLLIGTIILCVSFLFKWIQIVTKKNTIEVSLKTWLIMILGRALWSVYGFTLGTIGGIFILVANGLIALMNIPIIYYIIRNQKTEGKYHKDNFNVKLFVSRMAANILMIGLVATLATLSPYNQIIKPLPKMVSLLIGTIGGAITAVALVPQTIRIIKNKKTSSMSLPLQTTFILGNTIILSYLITMMVQQNNIESYIGSIIFGIFSTGTMVPILVIKLSNVIKHKEKIH